MEERNYSEITPYIRELADLSDERNHIRPEMYAKYDVKRGLRDLDGKGVVAGLTEVSHIKAKELDESGREIPCDGELFYRGVNVRSITHGFLSEDRHGFEETAYLLLFPNCRRRANWNGSRRSSPITAACRLRSCGI